MLSIQTPIKKQEGIQNLQYYKILESSFIYYIVGKPGSGKTHLITQLMSREDIYKDKFCKSILISPQRSIPCTHYIDNLDQKKLWQIFQEETQCKNIVIILDDVISQIHDLKNDVNFQNLIFNRRNIIPNCNISIIITSQKYILLPPNIRSCVTMLYFFQMFGNDLMRIKNEWIKSKNDKQKLDEALSKQQEYDFISIRANPYEIRLSFQAIQDIKDIQYEVQHKQPKQEKQYKTPERIKPKEELKENKTIQNIEQFFTKPEIKKQELPKMPKQEKGIQQKYVNSLYNLI